MNNSSGNTYKVLARTKRPLKFSDLLGQEVLVQTIRNAIEQHRLPHAFIFTGIRGVGKTTTARLIARALNCVGPDGNGPITTEPCGICSSCLAITEDRHMDVLEVDAASRTGVDDIRDLLEGISYRPVMGRYKIYIIDEVHMLSKNAFNALLKTLEEPPAHVKFIFATTEIKKVPVTILSRCQRFDLCRLTQDKITSYFADILKNEGLSSEPAALEILAKASEGSMRDALSLLEQAITITNATITEQSVRKMLGISDPTKLLDLFETLLSGDIKLALNMAHGLYHEGAEPESIIHDLMRMTHELLSLQNNSSGFVEKDRKLALAKKVSVPDLNQTWQILTKGLLEMKSIPLVFEALDVILIRVAYAHELNREDSNSEPQDNCQKIGPKLDPLLCSPSQSSKSPNNSSVNTFQDVVRHCETIKEYLLAAYLKENISLVHFQPEFIQLAFLNSAKDMAIINQLKKILNHATGKAWHIEIAEHPKDESLIQQKKTRQEKLLEKLGQNTDIQAIQEMFPGATIQL